MIRGTLILILLSFVALTLQQCTCNTASTALQQSQARFPFTFQDEVNLSTQPDTTSCQGWIANDWPGITSPIITLSTIQNFFASVTTSSCQANVNTAAALNATVHALLANLTAIKTKEQQEYAIMKADFDAWWAKFDELIAQKDDCKSCLQEVIDFMAVTSRQAYCGRLGPWIDVSLAATTNYAQLCNDRLVSLQGQLNISQTIDAQMVTCSCSRTLATAAVLVSVPVELLTRVTNLLNNITNYVTSVTTQVAANTASFADTTAQDALDAVDILELYALQARYELGDPYTYNDTINALNTILSNAAKKAAFLNRFIAYFRGAFTVTSPDITCTGLDGSSSTANCAFTGTITGSGDITAAVNNMTRWVKTVCIAYSGALAIDVSVGSVSTGTGAFTINIVIDPNAVAVVYKGITNAAVKAVDVITSIAIQAKADADALGALVGTNAAAVKASLDTQTSNLNADLSAAASWSASVSAKFAERSAAAAAYVTAQANAQASITVPTCWRVILAQWNNTVTKDIEDNDCCVQALIKRIEQAKADVDSAVQDLLTCNYNAANNPSDQSQQAYYQGASASLQANVQTKCTTRDQIQTRCSALNDTLAAKRAQYQKDIQVLVTKSANLDAGIEASISNIQTDCSNNGAAISAQISSSISGTLSTVNDVTVTINNADGSAGSYIEWVIGVSDSSTDTAEAIIAKHLACINATLTLIAQYTKIQVQYTGSVSLKRTTGNQYTASAGSAPPIAPTPVGTPTSAPNTPVVTPVVPSGTVPQSPSGAGVLVVSGWAILACLFALF